MPLAVQNLCGYASIGLVPWIVYWFWCKHRDFNQIPVSVCALFYCVFKVFTSPPQQHVFFMIQSLLYCTLATRAVNQCHKIWNTASSIEEFSSTRDYNNHYPIMSYSSTYLPIIIMQCTCWRHFVSLQEHGRLLHTDNSRCRNMFVDFHNWLCFPMLLRNDEIQKIKT